MNFTKQKRNDIGLTWIAERLAKIGVSRFEERRDGTVILEFHPPTEEAPRVQGQDYDTKDIKLEALRSKQRFDAMMEELRISSPSDYEELAAQQEEDSE